MESQQVESSASQPATSPPDPQNTAPLNTAPQNTAPQNTAPTRQEAFVRETPSLFSTSGISSWAKNLKIPQPSNQEDSESGNAGKSTFALFTSGFGLRLSPKSGQQDESVDVTATSPRPGVLGSFTKGIVDSSRSAVKAVQVKARHIVSQNKRRYQVMLLCYKFQKSRAKLAELFFI